MGLGFDGTSEIITGHGSLKPGNELEVKRESQEVL
jgi:hypothetical protein